MNELLGINVNDKTEKKGQLTYLSWAWAWAEVLKFDPAATWSVVEYGPENNRQPCCWIGDTAMVHTIVTIKGVERSCMLPVMDNKNNAVKNPDARKISDAIMRCMTKTAALHGLGLYIYAGEDLPTTEIDSAQERLEIIRTAANAAIEKFKVGDELGAYEEIEPFDSNDDKLVLWDMLKPHSALRATIKRLADEARKKQT
jgi:hypothetical protein